MTWDVIARQDWALTVGERSVKLLLGLVAVVIVVSAYVYPLAGDEPFTTARFAGFVVDPLSTVVPIVGVLLGYNAVVSDRESGALKLALALPHSRRDLVVGKFLGRAGLLSVATVAAMAVGGALVVYPFGELDLLPFLGFVGLTVAFGGIWTGIGIAASLAVATKRRALVLAFGLFFLFVMAWDSMAAALRVGLNVAGVLDGDLPAPLQFVVGLEPGHVFQRLTTGFVDPSASLSGPWYLGEWIALVLFACWLIGPLGLAYRRFDGSDLA